MPVVALDQVVDLTEIPAFCELPPRTGEELGVGAALLAQDRARFRQLKLVQLDRELDRAQPTHPGERTAERGQLRLRDGAEVTEPAAERLARQWVSLQILLECGALGTVARRLRTGHALPHDRLALTPFHAASVPAVTQVEGEVKNEELDAEREARRQLALAQIRQYPDPVLRMEARPVEDFDDDLRRLAARMVQLMKEANGAGLAATQVGVLRRVFVFTPEEDEVATLVNPEIVHRSQETEVDDEGCLSLQGVSVPVERSTAVRIEGRDENGNEVGYDFEGTPARIVQHELDHLDGKLMLDRTTPEARREAMGLLRPRVVIR
jgi:peptide deformylase